MSESKNFGRRSFVRSAGLGALGAAGLAAGVGLGTPAAAKAAPAGGGRLVDAGVGMHGTMTTANLISTASINRTSVTCGVGTAALDTQMLEGLPVVGPMIGSLPVIGGGWSGPFAMLMISYTVSSYQIDRPNGMLRAAGQMRSITEIGGVTIEDVEHAYVAVAKDARGMGRDSFTLSFKTPFWTVGANPMATPSNVVDGWSLFGGPLMVGEITVMS